MAATALVFGGFTLGAGTASAADGTEQPTLNKVHITVNGEVGGHTFKAYRLAWYGNKSEAQKYDQDGIVTESTDIKSTALRTDPDISDAMKTAAEAAAGTSMPGEYRLGGKYTPTEDNVTDNPAAWAASWTGTENEAKLRKFAETLAASTLPEAKSTITAAEGATSVVVVNSPYNDAAGWYLITDTDADGKTLGAPMLVGSTYISYTTLNGVALGIATVKPSETVEVPAPTKTADRTSQSVGCEVTYTVTGKLPDEIPTGYTYQFVDTADAGLTLRRGITLYEQAKNEDGSLKVDANGNPVFNNVATDRAASGDVDGQTLTVTLHSLNKRTPGSYVKIIYTATMGVDSDGFGKYVEPEGGYQYDESGIATVKNSVKIQYGADKATLAETASASASVKVYKGFDFTKIGADTNAGLAGAEFRIQAKKDDASASVTTNRSLATSADDGTVTFSGLAAGTYVVSETKVPTGYYANIRPSFEVTINENGTVAFGKDAIWDLVNTDEAGKATVTNVNQITQLPSTGGMGIGLLATAILLTSTIAVFFGAKTVKNRRIAARR